MYSTILKFVMEFLKANVTAEEVQVDYYANASGIDLRAPAVLLEPKIDNSEQHSNVWKRGEFHIRLWILAAMDIDVIQSMEIMERVLGAESGESGDEILGLNPALTKMREDPGFEALQGKMGSKRWRIGPIGLRTKGPTFSINQRTNGTRINTAQLDLYVAIETES